MGKASKKKRQQGLRAESILNGKSLISSDLSSKWSLFNKPLVHFFLIAIVGLLIYSNTFNVPFHFDDAPNIVENYKLRDLSNFWPPSGSRWFGYLTFALNYYFGGLNVAGYHIVNLIIHIFNAILVYWLVILTSRTPYFSPPFNSPFAKGGYRGVALFSALLFVSHPIQTQAVTYIVQRFTSLATFFYLLSLVMYIKARLEAKAKVKFFSASTLTFYIFSLISAILAMKTKEISFTLPVVIALYEFMFFEGKIKRRILFLMPIILTMLIIPLSLIGTDKPIGDAIGELRAVSQEGEEIPRWSYLFTQFRVIVTYIRFLFLPINQNLDYDYPLYYSFFNPQVFLSFLFLLIILALGVYLLYAKRYKLSATRLFTFGIFWFFITLFVESSVIPIRDLINEHRLYLPGIGLVVAFMASIFSAVQFIGSRRRFALFYSVPPLIIFIAAITIVLSIAAYQRNAVWQDEMSLWENVVRKSPQKARGHNNLGIAYYKEGLKDKAIVHYQIALKLKPDYAEAYNNLGIAYYKEGLTDKAIEHYLIALKLNPDYAEIYNNIGLSYYNKGLTDMAIEHYLIALRIKPDYVEAHNNLGNAYKDKGLTAKAIEHYQIALKLNPDYAEAHMNMANDYDDKGMTAKAIEHYQIALKLKPDYAEAHYNLGVAYGRRGLLDRAIKEYQIALRLNPRHKLAENSLNRILQIQKSK